MHCGHVAGLTPPDYWLRETDATRPLARLQRECWRYYAAQIKALKPIDTLLVCGDAIDGNGSRSGGTEQLTTDRHAQCDMAAECIALAEARNVVMVYGTPYHTGDAEDFEREIRRRVPVLKIGGHEWVEIDGVTFDLKHKIGSSSIPHGRHTAIARDRLWNLLWAERDEQPLAGIMLRAHDHYHALAGGAGWLAMTLPALQAAHTKYGSRQCSGTVDFGLVHFDIENGGYTWQAHLARLRQQRAEALRLT
jgi:hypothetical protein